jgi:hypothetical protein
MLGLGLSCKGVLVTSSWVKLTTLTLHYYKTMSSSNASPKQKATHSEQDVECNENQIKGRTAQAAIYARIAS